MAVFGRQTATAKRLIGKNGRKCIWRNYQDGTSSTAQPWKPDEQAYDDYEVIVCFLPETRTQFAFLQSIAGTDINVGDDYGLMPRVDFTPSNRAEVYDETGTDLLRTVSSVTPLAPNGTEIILYTLRFGVDE